MKRILLILLFCFILSISFYTGYQSKPQTIVNTTNYCPAFLDKNTDILWALVQNWRLENNLQPYAKNQKLCEIANIRVQEIQTDFSHDKFLTRFQHSPYVITENLVRHFPFEPDMLKAWIESPGHLTALKTSYTYACIACSNDNCVQIFSNLH